jgi:hypothetical protein
VVTKTNYLTTQWHRLRKTASEDSRGAAMKSKANMTLEEAIAQEKGQLSQTKTFERVGIFKEVVNWQEYADLLTSWASRSSWEFRIRRISEQPGCVFLELEEFSHYKESSDAIYSLSVLNRT